MNFLKDDQERADEELDCVRYCTSLGEKSFTERNYAESAAYFENVARSLTALDNMKQAKISFDKDWLFLKQLEGQQQVDNLLKGRTAVGWDDIRKMIKRVKS